MSLYFSKFFYTLHIKISFDVPKNPWGFQGVKYDSLSCANGETEQGRGTASWSWIWERECDPGLHDRVSRLALVVLASSFISQRLGYCISKQGSHLLPLIAAGGDLTGRMQVKAPDHWTVLKTGVWRSRVQAPTGSAGARIPAPSFAAFVAMASHVASLWVSVSSFINGAHKIGSAIRVAGRITWDDECRDPGTVPSTGKHRVRSAWSCVNRDSPQRCCGSRDGPCLLILVKWPHQPLFLYFQRLSFI